MGIDFFDEDDIRLRKQKLNDELKASLARNDDAVKAGDKAIVEYESNYRTQVQKELYYLRKKEEIEEEIRKASRNLSLAIKSGDKELIEKEKLNKISLENELNKINEILNIKPEEDFSEIPFEEVLDDTFTEPIVKNTTIENEEKLEDTFIEEIEKEIKELEKEREEVDSKIVLIGLDLDEKDWDNTIKLMDEYTRLTKEIDEKKKVLASRKDISEEKNTKNKKKKPVFRNFFKERISGIKDLISTKNKPIKNNGDLGEETTKSKPKLNNIVQEQFEKMGELINNQKEKIVETLNIKDKSKKRKPVFRNFFKERIDGIKGFFTKQDKTNEEETVFEEPIEENETVSEEIVEPNNSLNETLDEITELVTQETEDIEYTKKMNRRA